MNIIFATGCAILLVILGYCIIKTAIIPFLIKMGIVKQAHTKKVEVDPHVGTAGFDLEFFPKTGRFYPRYWGEYIMFSPISGCYETTPWIQDAIYEQHKDRAIDVIDRFRDQEKVHSTIIKLDI